MALPDVLAEVAAQVLGGAVARAERDVGVDRLPLDVVRDAHDGRLGDGRVQHERALDLGRAHAVPRDVDDVVHAARDGDAPCASRRQPSPVK